jgi:cholesterol transport system auxiliary component
MSWRGGLLLAGLGLALSGCVSLDIPGLKSSTPLTYYVLEDAGRAAPAGATPVARTLILVDTLTGAFYDNEALAFSRQPGTRGYYQYARWTERPGKRISDLLLARLEQEQLFAAVAQPGTNVHGDWLLTSEIVEFYHDATAEPGTIRLVLRAEVTDLKSHTLVSRRLFTQAVPVPRFDAGGAHQAFNQAVTTTLSELADWLRALSAKK